jgi:hypothetical protein
MLKLKLLLLLLLIQLVSFSQIDTVYNGAIVRINKQVFYLFDSITVDGIVKDVIRFDECLETQDSLKSIIKEQDFLSETKTKKIKELERKSVILKDNISIQESIIQNKDLYITKIERKNKLNKIGISILGTTTIISLAAALTTFLILR